MDVAAQGVGHDVRGVGHHAVRKDAATDGDGLRGHDVDVAGLGCHSRYVEQTSGGLGEGVGVDLDAAKFCHHAAAGRDRVCRCAGHGVGCRDGAAVEDAGGGLKQDAARAVDQTSGFNGAGVVDDAGLQAARGLGRQDDEAAGRFDGAFVFHQGVDGGGSDDHAAQGPVAIEFKLKGFTCGHGDGAQVGHDDAIVAHIRREHGHVAAQRSADFALVFNLACGAVAGEFDLPVHELLSGGGVRGGDKPAHVDTGCLTKVHTLRIDQHDRARRGDAAQNLARLRIHHAVERGGLGVGLQKVDRSALTKVEAGPVHHRPLAGLVDVERAARLADAGLARSHLAAGGQLGGSHQGRCRGLGLARSQPHAGQRHNAEHQPLPHPRPATPARTYTRARAQVLQSTCFR